MNDDDIIFGEKVRRSSPTPKTNINVLKIAIWSLIAVIAVSAIGFGISITSRRILVTEVRSAFSDHPVIRQHIGDWEACSILIFVKGEEQSPNPDLTGVIFELQGSKGSGILVVTVSPQPRSFQSASLVMDDGTTFEMEIEKPAR